jgi:hypothetical protein
MINKLFKNKKGFLTRDIVITAILFAGIAALYVLMVGSISNNYNNPNMTSPGFSSSYNKLNDLGNQVLIAKNTSEGGGGFSLLGSADIAFNAVFTVIKTVWYSLGLYGDMFSGITSNFGFLDSKAIAILGIILLSCLTIVIVFVWISSVTRGKL